MAASAALSGHIATGFGSGLSCQPAFQKEGYPCLPPSPCSHPLSATLLSFAAQRCAAGMFGDAQSNHGPDGCFGTAAAAAGAGLAAPGLVWGQHRARPAQRLHMTKIRGLGDCHQSFRFGAGLHLLRALTPTAGGEASASGSQFWEGATRWCWQSLVARCPGLCRGGGRALILFSCVNFLPSQLH